MLILCPYLDILQAFIEVWKAGGTQTLFILNMTWRDWTRHRKYSIVLHVAALSSSCLGSLSCYLQLFSSPTFFLFTRLLSYFFLYNGSFFLHFLVSHCHWLSSSSPAFYPISFSIISPFLFLLLPSRLISVPRDLYCEHARLLPRCNRLKASCRHSAVTWSRRHFLGKSPAYWKKKNSMVWVRERTIPTEWPPLVGEVIANLCG
jgi:hypothetical protein